MNTHVICDNQEIWTKLAFLRDSTDKTKKTALKKRITKQPHITDLEYLLGAYIEMYEPYLTQFVHQFSQKGYALDPTSGFGGKNFEFQTINGYFAIDFVTRNKLEKIGVKLRENNGSKSLIFWPKKGNLDEIKAKFIQIIGILPDKGILALPSETFNAIKFRRKYVPKDQLLQKERLFERLQYGVQRKVDSEAKRRKTRNPHPNKFESNLGVFLEELEPQVKQAVLEMNKKGYSTDVSGFMDDPRKQMIEGDFQLEDKAVKKLAELGVTVETTSSGYTRLQFAPLEVDLTKIKRLWNKIVSYLPNKTQAASPSMTRKAREFRVNYPIDS